MHTIGLWKNVWRRLNLLSCCGPVAPLITGELRGLFIQAFRGWIVALSIKSPGCYIIVTRTQLSTVSIIPQWTSLRPSRSSCSATHYAGSPPSSRTNPLSCSFLSVPSLFLPSSKILKPNPDPETTSEDCLMAPTPLVLKAPTSHFFATQTSRSSSTSACTIARIVSYSTTQRPKTTIPCSDRISCWSATPSMIGGAWRTRPQCGERR